jgi:hypothetical protein
MKIQVRVRCEAGADWEMKRGAKEYERGAPIPATPSDEDAQVLTAEFYYWIGYMLARGKKLMAQWRAEQFLTNPDPDEPRPRKAA